MNSTDILTDTATVELLLAARSAHDDRNWRAAYDAFTRAGGRGPLSTDDLDAMAMAAWRVGNVREAVRLSELVFTRLTRTDPVAAAMKAVELGLAWLTRGDLNIGRGWMNRARRLLEGAPESPAHGYLAYLDAVMAAMEQDAEALGSSTRTLRGVAERTEVPALTALGLVAEGLHALFDDRLADAYGLIDEAMLPVLADQVPVEWAGDIYCIVLYHCHRLADVPRMRAWTESMERWCGLSGSVAYGGVCDVHRLQVVAATEDYQHLEERLADASRRLEDVNNWAAAEGYYQLGEVCRLRGDAEGAAAAFAKARSLGADPQPGEALLRCSQGDKQAAWAGLRVALAGESGVGRMRLLRAAVDVALARDSLDEAELYCAELEEGARARPTPGFRAWAAHTRGALLVRRGRHADALDALHTALREYRNQQARYETAQVYEWMALAHKGLGDTVSASADSATAEAIYRQLGVEAPLTCGDPTPGGLTKREVDVLRHIAVGATNREVAQELVISEKTVGRHLANIYDKLGVSSRTAAVAWAFQNIGDQLDMR
ncbi:helix-turn-helix domain-containing protein [Mycolicibacterium palauense]|uniref:helix-turn-helix domain-containing protein n=1 Tax=Mycolicibacterium palauense TaxID=2034511 RepID=UPI000BFECC34|nr:helix-turn-helix transcriptional regulator [Mycolicibacterium palauense]